MAQSGLIFAISYSTSNAGWRAALAVTFIPATILLPVLPWVPESREHRPRRSDRLDTEPSAVSVRERKRRGMSKGSLETTRGQRGGRADCPHRGSGDRVRGDASWYVCRSIIVRSISFPAITWDQEHGQDKWAALWNSKAARYRSFVACSSQSWWGECWPLSLFTSSLTHIAWNGGSIFTYYYTIVFTNAGITDPHVQFGISAIQNASWCVGGIVGGYMLDIWGRRTNYLIGTGQAFICLIIQGSITLGVFDKGKSNHAAGAGFVSVYIIQWFLWVTFFSPGE